MPPLKNTELYFCTEMRKSKDHQGIFFFPNENTGNGLTYVTCERSQNWFVANTKSCNFQSSVLSTTLLTLSSVSVMVAAMYKIKIDFVPTLALKSN